MIVPARRQQRWDTLPYQRIASAAYTGSAVEVAFEDETRVGIDPQQLLPKSSSRADWSALTHSDHEIVVPTADGDVEVSWLRIRALTDPAFEAHLQAMAAEEDRFIGDRIAKWRRERGWGIEELARRAELPPETVASVEAGRTRAGFSLLERILTPFGATLDDLAAEPEPSTGPTLAAHSTTST